MTPEKFQERYYLATGIEIDSETAAELIKFPSSGWHKKILQMADDVESGSVWDRLQGEYNVRIKQ
jgi:hypothetical protein